MIIHYEQDQHTGGWQTLNWLAVAISILFILLSQLSPTTNIQPALDNNWCSSVPVTKRDLTTAGSLAQRELRDQRCAQRSAQ